MYQIWIKILICVRVNNETLICLILHSFWYDSVSIHSCVRTQYRLRCPRFCRRRKITMRKYCNNFQGNKKDIDFTPMIYQINPITFFLFNKIFKKYFQQEKPVMKYLKMSENKWNCYRVVNPVAVFTRKSGGKGCVKPNLVKLLRDLLEF